MILKENQHFLTNAILELFLVNNKLCLYGDRLVADLGLTASRWQVLHYIIELKAPQSVAWIAKGLSANRQNIQRIVNDLIKKKWIELKVNPHHKKSYLVIVTDDGKNIYLKAMERQNIWIHQLMQNIEKDDIYNMRMIFKRIMRNLEE